MLESGEYFLSPEQKAARAKAVQQAQQAQRVEERKRQREEAFVAPQVRVESEGQGEGRQALEGGAAGLAASPWGHS